MDIALTFDPVNFRFDLGLAGGDLAIDNGLKTAVMLSLFTDRLAEPDDALPDGTDRRGWWADLPLQPTAGPVSARKDMIGSRLWLLAREKATELTRQRAMAYAREALQWMLDDGIAEDVSVSATWGGLDRLDMAIAVSQRGAGGNRVDHRFDVFWQSELGA